MRTTLTEELEALERTDPKVAEAARGLDVAVEQINRGGSYRERARAAIEAAKERTVVKHPHELWQQAYEEHGEDQPARIERYNALIREHGLVTSGECSGQGHCPECAPEDGE